jgi:hypothetical protein
MPDYLVLSKLDLVLDPLQTALRRSHGAQNDLLTTSSISDSDDEEPTAISMLNIMGTTTWHYHIKCGVEDVSARSIFLEFCRIPCQHCLAHLCSLNDERTVFPIYRVAARTTRGVDKTPCAGPLFSFLACLHTNANTPPSHFTTTMAPNTRQIVRSFTPEDHNSQEEWRTPKKGAFFQV